MALDWAGRHSILGELCYSGRRWYLLLVSSVTLSYMVAGKWLVQLWVGQHAPSADWMYIAAGAALFFNTLARWPISFAYAMIRLAPLVRVAGIEVACKLMLTVLFFPYCTIAAPIVATVIVHLCFAVWAYQRTVAFRGEKP